jgi:hypothetical protein
VTEADTRRGSDAVRASEEVSSCEAVACGVLALCAAVVFGVSRWNLGSVARETPVIKREVRASGGCLGTERR